MLTHDSATLVDLSPRTKPIAVVQGAENHDVQRLFQEFAEKWRCTHRLVGVVEESDDMALDRSARSHLRVITTGRRYPLFQDLGPISTSCGLYADGVLMACEAVRQEIIAGCDIAVISKFGKLEAESRSGLISAFTAAIEADVPVLTSVAPKFDSAWARFAAPLFTILPADISAIERWWKNEQA